MSFKLGQRVVITGDSLEQNLPVGEYAYIIAFERNPDNVFDYIVRIPQLNRHLGVTERDVEAEEILLSAEADRVIGECLMDFALAKRDELLFRKLTGMAEEYAVQENQPEQMSPEEFIRQVNLKAWI